MNSKKKKESRIDVSTLAQEGDAQGTSKKMSGEYMALVLLSSLNCIKIYNYIVFHVWHLSFTNLNVN